LNNPNHINTSLCQYMVLSHYRSLQAGNAGLFCYPKGLLKSYRSTIGGAQNIIRIARINAGDLSPIRMASAIARWRVVHLADALSSIAWPHHAGVREDERGISATSTASTIILNCRCEDHGVAPRY